MLPSYAMLRDRLGEMIDDKERQGRETDGLSSRLADVPDDYEQLARLGREIDDLPMRTDWPYIEPDDLPSIKATWSWDGVTVECAVDLEAVEAKAYAGFLGRVCGCVLGKPVEIHATLATLREAFERVGEWPIVDYISERVYTKGGLERLHRSWPESVRERLTYVPPDDDIHYTLIGLQLLERHGVDFTQNDIAEVWINQLPLRWTFGPERATLVKLGLSMLGAYPQALDASALAESLNPGEELCGAMIRADAYGYACPGRPELAAELAWRDASLTHRRTGVYGSMFAAAAIASAFVVDDPLEVFGLALGFVPRESRFHRIVADSLDEVTAASSWEDGYERVHGKYAEYTHCTVFQETGTLINTMRFAESVGHGIGLQVMQGNDTDSYGATAGSLLGIRFGSDGLDRRWLDPFQNTIRTQLAGFHDYDLDALAHRVSRLVHVAGVAT